MAGDDDALLRADEQWSALARQGGDLEPLYGGGRLVP